MTNTKHLSLFLCMYLLCIVDKLGANLFHSVLHGSKNVEYD